jgi:hypothetical protein
MLSILRIHSLMPMPHQMLPAFATAGAAGSATGWPIFAEGPLLNQLRHPSRNSSRHHCAAAPTIRGRSFGLMEKL